MIRADHSVAPVGGGLSAQEMARFAALVQAEAPEAASPVAAAPATWRFALSPPAHGGSLGPAAVALVLAELGRAVVARVAPGGGVAPSSGALAVVGGLAASRALRASADPRVPLGALAAARVAGCGAAALPAAALASLLAVEADAAAVRSAVVVPAPPPQLVFVVAVFAAALVFLVATFERLLEASTRDASMLVVAAAALAAGSLLPDARSFLRGD